MLRNESKIIRGIITNGDEVLVDAVVQNLNTGKSYFTDTDGKYAAEAAEGEFLKYSFYGFKEIEIKVEDVTRILNVKLEPKVNVLEGVTVTKRLHRQERLEQEYESNEQIIRTFLGYRNVGLGRVVDMEDNGVSYACLVELLKAKFPFIRVFGDCSSVDNAIFSGRVNSILNPTAMSFEIDGHLMRHIPEIPVYEIKRIAVLTDPMSTNLYGIGGVIVINTFAFSPKTPTISEKLGLSHIFEKRSKLKEVNTLDSKPYYLNMLEKNESVEDAKLVYKELENKYSSSPYFFLDSYEFFYEKGEIDFSDKVIDKGFKILFNKNPVVLKALAYIYEEQGRFHRANEVFRQVFILRPSYAQSYFNLANSYRDLDDYDFSAELYTRYDYLVREGFFKSDSSSFNQFMKKELDNLVSFHNDALSFGNNIKKLGTKSINEPTTRIVVEWNDSEAEFDLEFLQDKNEYYVWNHNYDENKEDINDEKRLGYSVVEYTIDNGNSSKPWKIYIDYLGNKSLTPTYFKITRYNNYGTRLQTKKVEVFKLTIKNIKQELLSL